MRNVRFEKMRQNVKWQICNIAIKIQRNVNGFEKLSLTLAAFPLPLPACRWRNCQRISDESFFARRRCAARESVSGASDAACSWATPRGCSRRCSASSTANADTRSPVRSRLILINLLIMMLIACLITTFRYFC